MYLRSTQKRAQAAFQELPLEDTKSGSSDEESNEVSLAPGASLNRQQWQSGASGEKKRKRVQRRLEPELVDQEPGKNCSNFDTRWETVCNQRSGAAAALDAAASRPDVEPPETSAGDQDGNDLTVLQPNIIAQLLEKEESTCQPDCEVPAGLPPRKKRKRQRSFEQRSLGVTVMLLADGAPPALSGDTLMAVNAEQ